MNGRALANRDGPDFVTLSLPIKSSGDKLYYFLLVRKAGIEPARLLVKGF